MKEGASRDGLLYAAFPEDILDCLTKYGNVRVLRKDLGIMLLGSLWRLHIIGNMMSGAQRPEIKMGSRCSFAIWSDHDTMTMTTRAVYDGGGGL